MRTAFSYIRDSNLSKPEKSMKSISNEILTLSKEVKYRESNSIQLVTSSGKNLPSTLKDEMLIPCTPFQHFVVNDHSLYPNKQYASRDHVNSKPLLTGAIAPPKPVGLHKDIIPHGTSKLGLKVELPPQHDCKPKSYDVINSAQHIVLSTSSMRFPPNFQSVSTRTQRRKQKHSKRKKAKKTKLSSSFEKIRLPSIDGLIYEVQHNMRAGYLYGVFERARETNVNIEHVIARYSEYLHDWVINRA
ncbi:hypothetical protein NEOLI_004787 [Neolecta irregularis DAH-3]|uniref:Uncharacterized protein n=1 Tax=Neolecta irregularis (strain DAH-3) TaxID=1198029 RepID=A0A1U7LMD2_NEOID|nr:hypothetical protein NEOLI_004787 [Neolecta irregularis DAH-3]|eukprot:OLL23815.1 hypothetical protein NEOLI_004787 [Neolecta irregularis DAH-3]